MKERLHNIFSLGVIACVLLGGFWFSTVLIDELKNPDPIIHTTFMCNDDDEKKVLQLLAKKSPKEQLKFWSEIDFKSELQISKSPRWVLQQGLCDEEIHGVSVVAYKGLLEPVIKNRGSFYTSEYFYQLGHKPMTRRERSEREETSLFVLVGGFGLFVLSYLLFGGIRLRFW